MRVGRWDRSADKKWEEERCHVDHWPVQCGMRRRESEERNEE
jgi:hypothetical protein